MRRERLDSETVFAGMEPRRAVRYMAFPAIVSQLIVLLYNLADTFFPGYGREWWLIGLHLIGRLAAPILWFMAAEGYRHTHNLKKYLLRLFVFAVVSHFAYTFCFGISPIPFRDSVLNQTSVIWPLFLAVVALYVCDDEKRAFPLVWQKTLLILLLCAVCGGSAWIYLYSYLVYVGKMK